MPDPATPYLRQPATGGMTDRLLWLYHDGRLHVQHGRDHGHDVAWTDAAGVTVDDCESHYRGWFDPATKELFVVRPRQTVSPSLHRRIPGHLDRLLRRRFGDGFAYLLF